MQRKQLRKYFIKPTQAQIDEFNKIDRRFYLPSQSHFMMRRNDVKSITHTGYSIAVHEWFMKHFGDRIPMNKEDECLVFGLPLSAVLQEDNYLYDRKKVNILSTELQEKNYAVYIYETMKVS